MPSCHIKDADVPTKRNLIHKSIWDFLVSEQQQLILGLRFFSCPCPDTISTAQYVTMSVEHHYSIRHFTTLLRDPGRLWHLRNIIRVIRRHILTNDKDKNKGKGILRTPSKSDLWELWLLRRPLRVMRKHDLANKKTTTTRKTKNNFEDTIVHLKRAIIQKLWNFWHFWQLRTSQHCNHSDPTIKSDTGQHSQFLQCLWISSNSLNSWGFEIFVKLSSAAHNWFPLKPFDWLEPNNFFADLWLEAVLYGETTKKKRSKWAITRSNHERVQIFVADGHQPNQGHSHEYICFVSCKHF